MGEKHNGPVTRDGIRIHSEADFAGMRAAGRLAADILDRIGEHVFVGQSTAEIDRIVEDMVNAAGAKSATQTGPCIPDLSRGQLKALLLTQIRQFVQTPN